MKLLNHPTKTIALKQFLALGLEDCSYRNDECGSMIHPQLDMFGVYPAYDVHAEECPLNPESWSIFDYDANDTIGTFNTAEVVKFFKERLDRLKAIRPIIKKVDNDHYIVKFDGVSIDYASNVLPETLKYLMEKYPNAILEKKTVAKK